MKIGMDGCCTDTTDTTDTTTRISQNGNGGFVKWNLKMEFYEINVVSAVAVPSIDLHKEE